MPLLPSRAPGRVNRWLVPARVERWLAFLVAALTWGAVVGLELGLVREWRLGRAPTWALVVAGLAVVLLAWRYARRLGPRLRRQHPPRWRLTFGDAGRLLPPTLLAFWTVGGFATYPQPWDWAVSAVSGAGLAFLVLPDLLAMLERRVAIAEQPVAQGPDTAAS
jgi:hypothetical protein